MCNTNSTFQSVDYVVWVKSSYYIHPILFVARKIYGYILVWCKRKMLKDAKCKCCKGKTRDGNRWKGRQSIKYMYTDAKCIMKRWAAHGLIPCHLSFSPAQCANLLSMHSHINIINEQYVICLHRKTCKLIKLRTYRVAIRVHIHI